MKRVCAWCRTVLGHKAFDEPGETHGICDECREFLRANRPAELLSFLERIPCPVMLVTEQAIVRAANREACSLWKKELSEIEGLFQGQVMECIYARLPGGCGRTVHCAGCAIRNSVTTTWATGRECREVPAFQQITKKDGTVEALQLTISTRKLGDAVLLRVDEVKGGRVPVKPLSENG